MVLRKMTTFVTADQHWFHKNIIRYCNRPFASVEQMNYEMIKRWNAKLGRSDTVIHLGDFALVGKNWNKLTWLRQNLNGNIKLLCGNHDNAYHLHRIGITIYPGDTYTYKNLIFSHRPLEVVPKGFVNVHGHIHEKKSYGNRINISVDVTRFAPVRLTYILLKSRLLF